MNQYANCTAKAAKAAGTKISKFKAEDLSLQMLPFDAMYVKKAAVFDSYLQEIVRFDDLDFLQSNVSTLESIVGAKISSTNSLLPKS